MSFRSLTFKTLLAVLLVAGLTHCSLTPPGHSSAAGAGTEPRASVAAFAQDWQAKKAQGGQLFAIDPARSKVRIYAFRAGAAARLGHNHVLSAPEFDGYYYQPSDPKARGEFALRFELAKLEIDNPDYRRLLGPAFQSKLSREAIEGTRDHMLGESNFQADRFPLIWVRSVSIAGEAPKYIAEVALEIHGTTRQLRLPLTATVSGDVLQVAGAFAFRQTDFGVQPYSVLGGMLAVQDEVAVEFELTGKPI